MTQQRLGGKLRLTRQQWADLSLRMHGENLGGWIMSAGWQRHGSDVEPCVAITIDPNDVSTVTIFLTHIIEVTHEPEISVGETLEDLRYLADQVQTFKPGGFVYPTYYLPCVTTDGDVE
jgi:hypothetical protein